MAQLTGVYRGKRGVLYPLARFLGFRSCNLAAITESRRGLSPAWKTLIATLEGEGVGTEAVRHTAPPPGG